jgi:hypothetical protein
MSDENPSVSEWDCVNVEFVEYFGFVVEISGVKRIGVNFRGPPFDIIKSHLSKPNVSIFHQRF